MVFYAQERLQLIRFFYGGYHDQVLQVRLQHVPALIHNRVTRRSTTWWADTTARYGQVLAFFEFVEASLGKLVAALRELDAWVLVYEGLVQLAEAFVLLAHGPGFFSVEGHLDVVFGVSSVIERVFKNYCVFYYALQLHLEEVRPAKVTQILRAGFNMLKENLCWIERMAKLALTGHAVLEAFGVDLQLL